MDKISELLTLRDDNNGTLPLRCLNISREDLARIMNVLGFKTGAEIGVWRGAYSAILCHAIPGLKLKCIDPWVPFQRNTWSQMESRYQTTRKRLRKFRGAEVIRKTSIEAVREFSDNSLDFVFIDGMHEFDSVMVDIILWAPKVRLRGIVAGHDYSPVDPYIGVMPAVQAYTQVHNITEWYITDDEPDKSFFWVKE